MNKDTLQTSPVEYLLPKFPFASGKTHWVSFGTPVKLVEDDVWRINNHYYSHDLFCATDNSIVLDIGGRSGLFSLYFASLGINVKVLTVEQNADYYSYLAKTLKQVGTDNIDCFHDLGDALRALDEYAGDGESFISLVMIDKYSFDFGVLEKISSRFKFGHLCGEFDESRVRPIDLYRLSENCAQSFSWRNTTRKTLMSGVASSEIEVSIIVPMYNVEEYLPKCLDSLISQTIRSKEIILVDDGSPDASGQIADEWADRHPEIRVIHQENAGCAAARSRGLAEARGRFVGFVDSDDWVDAPMFEKLYEAAVTNNAEVAQCGFREVYVDDNLIIPRTEEFRYAQPDLGTKLIANVKDLITTQPTIWRRLYKTEFLRGKGIDFPHHIPRYDDLPFQFEVFIYASRMVCIPEIYYNYRLGRVGQDVSLSDERLYVHFDIFKTLREKLLQTADVSIERSLKKVEINTHNWGVSRIDLRFKWQYATWAARDIFGDRALVGRWDVFRVLWKQSRKRAVLALLIDLLLPGDVGKYAKDNKGV